MCYVLCWDCSVIGCHRLDDCSGAVTCQGLDDKAWGSAWVDKKQAQSDEITRQRCMQHENTVRFRRQAAAQDLDMRTLRPFFCAS